MSDTPKILAFAGSARRDSINKKLLKAAVAGAEKAGAEVRVIDLHDYSLPIYDGDLETEKGVPENARKIKAQMKASDGFLIASPEYNSSISALLKNTIDWASRQEEGESNLECFVGKVAGLVATSPGQLGGLRGLVHLRSILMNLQTLVIPNQAAVPSGHKAIAGDGTVSDDKLRERVEKVGAVLAETACRMKSTR
ncbi:MAG: NADPH-dependent FMN reductase [Candidatus Zixiibacteriota bacterium]